MAKAWTVEKQCRGKIWREGAFATYGRECKRSATVGFEGKRYCRQHAKRVRALRRLIPRGPRGELS